MQNKQQTQEMKFHAVSGIRILYPSNQAAAIQRLQTYALDHTATGIGSRICSRSNVPNYA
jgi:hypothetical protein